MKKIIDISEDIKVILKDENGNISITKEYYKDKILYKSITFSAGDVPKIKVYINKKYLDKIFLDFTIGDIIYFPLNRLINNSSCLIIEDDLTRTPLSKYIMIFKTDISIRIKLFDDDFVNNKDDINFEITCYHENDIVDSFIKFINEIKNNMIEEYHQYTIDEYLEIKRLISIIEKIEYERIDKCCINCDWLADEQELIETSPCYIGSTYTNKCESFKYSDSIKEKINEELKEKVYKRV